MDIYAKQIRRLKGASEGTLFVQWCRGVGVFAFCSSTGYGNGHDNLCGCLSMVKKDYYSVDGGHFQDEIRADEKLNTATRLISHSDLGRYAYWQRKLDKVWPGRYKHVKNALQTHWVREQKEKTTK
ncbi:MAG: hypothetical protein O3B41_11735 [Bacteroidetes bacterium]|nr:hypothetical protein [Bacteroidota bacterium]